MSEERERRAVTLADLGRVLFCYTNTIRTAIEALNLTKKKKKKKKKKLNTTSRKLIVLLFYDDQRESYRFREGVDLLMTLVLLALTKELHCRLHGLTKSGIVGLN